MGENMKTCPICGSQAIDRATTCFECLYNFKEMSAGVVLFSELEKAVTPLADLNESTHQGDPQGAEACPINSPKTAESLTEDAQLFCDLLIEMYRRNKLTCRYRSHSGSLYVGAADFNDIEINMPSIAKRHLHFYRSGEAIFAETLSSKSPVFLNGHSLDGAAPISPRDTITMGDVRFALSSTPSEILS